MYNHPKAYKEMKTDKLFTVFIGLMNEDVQKNILVY
jgi:hypothetical protein